LLVLPQSLRDRRDKGKGVFFEALASEPAPKWSRTYQVTLKLDQLLEK
jgi:hypothetical protein